MYTLDTISSGNIVFSAEMNIKMSDTVTNIIVALSRVGRNTFTADDIVYIINRNVKADWNKVTDAQVTRVIKTEIRHNARGEYRYGMKQITAIGNGFYQYGK